MFCCVRRAAWRAAADARERALCVVSPSAGAAGTGNVRAAGAADTGDVRAAGSAVRSAGAGGAAKRQRADPAGLVAERGSQPLLSFELPASRRCCVCGGIAAECPCAARAAAAQRAAAREEAELGEDDGELFM